MFPVPPGTGGGGDEGGGPCFSGGNGGLSDGLPPVWRLSRLSSSLVAAVWGLGEGSFDWFLEIKEFAIILPLYHG